MRVRADEKGLALRCTIASDVPHSILCDRTRVRQVLLNLVGNAIKFTQKGSVDLDVTLADTAPARLVFTVRDTGTGIAEAVLPRLFNRFAQATPSTARTHGGTGLGLAISREIATLMKGTLEATSTPGSGSSFSLTIPIEGSIARAEPQSALPDIISAPAPAPAPAPVSAPAPFTTSEPEIPTKLGETLNVLLAEDQPVNQKLMCAVMERLGHRLTIANNGVEAVRAVRKERFDLILMDIQMPELDGILTTKVIRSADEDWRDMPIIALTAHAMESHRQSYLAAGMDGFVSKPFRMDVLVGEMARVLNGAPKQVDTMVKETPAPEGTKPGRKESALSAMLDDLESLTV
jgi:CheY-like chemotaxis protein